MDTQNSDKCRLPVSGVQGQSGPVVTPSVLVHCPPTQSQCYFLKEVVNPASRHSRRTTVPISLHLSSTFCLLYRSALCIRVLPSHLSQTRQCKDHPGIPRSREVLRSGPFVKNFQHRAKERGAMELFVQFSKYVVAELKIKSSFYDDENRRTTEKFLIHSKTTVFRKRKLIQYPFKFT